jgi:hypothetical protein
MNPQDHVRFSHESVRVDGQAFSNCEFTGCRMVYAGGKVPEFSDCRFQDCEWKFDEAASQTLSYLRLMWNVGAKAAVQSTIKDITIAAR